MQLEARDSLIHELMKEKGVVEQHNKVRKEVRFAVAYQGPGFSLKLFYVPPFHTVSSHLIQSFQQVDEHLTDAVTYHSPPPFRCCCIAFKSLSSALGWHPRTSRTSWKPAGDILMARTLILHPFNSNSCNKSHVCNNNNNSKGLPQVGSPAVSPHLRDPLRIVSGSRPGDLCH